jgi:hypothetical protein
MTLIITTTETYAPPEGSNNFSPAIWLGLHFYELPHEPPYYLAKGELLHTSTGERTPLFISTAGFGYEWAPDSRHIVVESYCYGDNLGSGLHVIDTQSLSLTTLSPEYWNNCEGGIAYQLQPSNDKPFILYGPDILQSLDGKEQIHLCQPEEGTRSYAWSPSGEFVYIDCIPDGAQSDTLIRYNVRTRESVVLVRPETLPMKAIKMSVSPNGNYLVFVWGTSNFFNREERGVWLLNLDQLSP